MGYFSQPEQFLGMKKMRNSGRFWLFLYFCLMVLLLSACSSTPKPKQSDIVRKEFNFRLLFVKNIPNMPKARARAIFKDGTCYVMLKEEDYLGCLLHEVRHCLEGAWHGNDVNDEYCEEN